MGNIAVGIVAGIVDFAEVEGSIVESAVENRSTGLVENTAGMFEEYFGLYLCKVVNKVDYNIEVDQSFEYLVVKVEK